MGLRGGTSWQQKQIIVKVIKERLQNPPLGGYIQPVCITGSLFHYFCKLAVNKSINTTDHTRELVGNIFTILTDSVPATLNRSLDIRINLKTAMKHLNYMFKYNLLTGTLCRSVED